MHSKRLSECLCLAAAAVLIVATGAMGQVDWSELFPEEGAKAVAKAPPREAPAAVAPAPRHIEQARPQPPAQIAKPHREPSEAPRYATRPKPARRLATIRPRTRSDSEFPAASDVAAPHFDRHSNRRSSPPPGTVDEQDTAAAEERPAAASAPVIAKADLPAPQAVVAAREPAPEAVPARAAANKAERPVAYESVQPATAEVAPEPVAQPVAPVAAGRAAKAVAAQQAKHIVAEEAPRPAAADAPVQVAALPADVAMTNSGHRTGAPRSGAGSAVAVEPGIVITDKNMDQYSSVLTPGLDWVLQYGLRMRVIAPRHVKMIRPYLEATEKYAGQVKLSADGTRLTNWTAGQPFPDIDPNDPQAAVKVMWNYSYGWVATDDLNAELFDADTGAIGKNRGMSVERHYMIDNLRRLNYTGRLFVDPKPALPNPDAVRYKESLHPLSEPFDLKGVGFTYYRFDDPNRQDDSWLYLPQLRRVRRLSTAQRSDALFGQDSDVDSYYGYAGNIGWMDWKLLGERTVMGIMHAQNVPAKWQQPEDWAIDEVWEPRQVYAVEGTSKAAQYAYGKRVIYIDKEAWIVLSSDIYDRAGQLWKVWLNSNSIKKEAIPGAKVSRYPEEVNFVTAITMVDTQLVHATKASLPSSNSQGTQECIFLNMGEKSGTTEEFFTVANLIEMGH